MGVAAKVLAEQLQRYGHGDALWDPAPTTDEEVRLGDVGIIDEEGSFMRLFNVMVDAKDSLNKGGVPDGFKPLILNKRLQKFMPQCHAPGPLTSSTIGHTSAKGHAGANVGNIAGGGAMYQFACSSECGAWLLLKDFSDKTYLLDTGNLKKYMLQHHDAWYNFATGESLGIDCKPYDIILVKGFVKTSAWAVAAYKSGVRSTQAMSLTGTVGGVGEAGFEFRVDSSEGYMFDTRYGPEGRDAKALQSSRHVPTVFPRDQSVFLSYYKIKQRMWWKKIVAHAGPHVLPRGPNEEQNTAVMTDMEGSIEEVPGRQLVRIACLNQLCSSC
ncbi:hypothetical protein BC835DRAFT_1288098 [Cytidiella melzeri]|nr:hypothetical protein BC835DRAFT_1288098 [Cytidiella melzeri]